MNESPLHRVRLVVRGQVQGVCFRARARDEALALGLVGWVRNLTDRSVEIVAEGPRVALESLVAWARKGPPTADVTDIEIIWSTAASDLDSFVIRY